MSHVQINLRGRVSKIGRSRMDEIWQTIMHFNITTQRIMNHSEFAC